MQKISSPANLKQYKDVFRQMDADEAFGGILLTLMNIKENWVFLFKNLRRTGSCPLQRKDLRRIREWTSCLPICKWNKEYVDVRHSRKRENAYGYWAGIEAICFWINCLFKAAETSAELEVTKVRYVAYF